MAYEGYQGYGGSGNDPQSLANRLAMAQLMAGSQSTNPIRSKYQGYAQLAQAIMGGLALRQAQGQQTQMNSQLGEAGSAIQRALLGAGIGAPILPPSQGAEGGGLSAPPVSDNSGPMAPNNSSGGAPPGAMPGAMPGGSLPGNQVASNNPGFAPGFTEPSSDSASGGGGSAGAPTPLMGSLTAMGYSPNAAAGILGNFKQESGLNPANASGDGGTSIGLGQWHAGRAAELQQFAASQGQDWRNPAVQFAFTDKEISQTPGLKEAMNNAGSPQEAAALFMNKFERPAPATANLAGRENYAAQFAGGGGQPDSSMMVAGPGAPSSRGAGYNPTAGIALPGVDYGQLMQIAISPNVTPEARAMAGQLLDRAMTLASPHPLTRGTNPGTNDQVFYDWMGRPVYTQAGPHPIEQVESGPDIMGQNPHYVLDKQTGNLIRIGGPQAQGGAPAATPAAPGPAAQPAMQPPPAAGSGVRITNQAGGPPPQIAGQTQPAPAGSTPGTAASDPFTAFKVQGEDQLPAIAQQLAPQVGDQAAQQGAQLARAYIRGQIPLPSGNAQTKPIEQLAINMALKADPSFSSSVASARADAIKAYTDKTNPNSPGGMILNANTALGHLNSLADASDALAQMQGGSSIMNEIKGGVSTHAPVDVIGAGTDLAKARAKYTAALTPFIDEIGKFYAGGQGTEANREKLEASLGVNAPPEARKVAMQQLSQLLQTKVGVLQNQWHTVMGQGSSDFPILYPEAKAAIERLQPQAQQQAQPQPQQQGPIKIQNDEDYSKLPSGTRYTAPDGTIRTKR